MTHTVGRTNVLVAVAFGVALMLATARAAFALPGDLDSSFDGDGMASFDRGVSESGYAVVVGPGEKLYVAGVATGGDLLVLRVKPGGKRDETYGDHGFAVVSSGASSLNPYAISVLPNGTAFVAGQTVVGSLTEGFVAKITPGGEPAASFGGGDGVALVKNGSSDVFVYGLVPQPNGKVVAGGGTSITSSDGRFFLARLKPNGAIDPTFGNGGRTQTNFGPESDFAIDLVRQSDGKLVLGGWTQTGSGPTAYDTAFARYSANGLLDHSFGEAGRSVVSLWEDGLDYASGLAVLPNDKVVACEKFSVVGFGRIAVLRLTTAGKADTSFGGGDGSTILGAPAGSECVDIAATAGGKIVVGAYAGSADPFSAVRLLGNGRLDRAFGEGGVASAPFEGSSPEVRSVAVQRNGRIVAAGSVNNGSIDVAVARFLP